MSRLRVTILIGRSLLMEGIASQLRAQPELVELAVVPVTSSATLKQLQRTDPGVVVFDATDSSVGNALPLSRLLAALPEVQIIRLDPRGPPAQVISSRQRATADATDLIQLVRELSSGTVRANDTPGNAT